MWFLEDIPELRYYNVNIARLQWDYDHLIDRFIANLTNNLLSNNLNVKQAIIETLSFMKAQMLDTNITITRMDNSIIVYSTEPIGNYGDTDFHIYMGVLSKFYNIEIAPTQKNFKKLISYSFKIWVN